jgi:hypothetical protein
MNGRKSDTSVPGTKVSYRVKAIAKHPNTNMHPQDVPELDTEKVGKIMKAVRGPSLFEKAMRMGIEIVIVLVVAGIIAFVVMNVR